MLFADYFTGTLDDAAEKAQKVIDAINGNEKKTVITARKKEVSEAMASYNKEVCEATYKAWRDEGDPVRTAVRELTVPNCKKCVFKETKSGLSYFAFDEMEVKINLRDMQNIIGNEHFTDPAWDAAFQKFAFVFAGGLCGDLASKSALKIVIDKAAEEFDFGGVNPYSVDGMGIALQKIFDMILTIPGEDGNNTIVAGKPQVTFLRNAMTKYSGKKGVIQMCDLNSLIVYVLEAMHITLTGGNFGLIAE